MFEDIKRLSPKHKNNKIWYYALNNVRQYLPKSLFQSKLISKINKTECFDMEYVMRRVNYYNQLDKEVSLPSTTLILKDFKIEKRHKTHFFDSFEFTRYFSDKLKIDFLFGDVTFVPEHPSIVKSRPIDGNLANSVVLNLGKIRHFLFIKDDKKFQDKKSMLASRSKARQPHRLRFLEMYFDHPLCNIGQVNRDANLQFLANRMTIEEHLDYKFILCLEGNDVASNLKWVMSSNSLAVMPKPKFETWFMEKTLIPNYHYVEIKDDYSDLIEKMEYYSSHIDESVQIIENAHRYIDQFKNKKQEDLISLLVLKKYFEKTGQHV